MLLAALLVSTAAAPTPLELSSEVRALYDVVTCQGEPSAGAADYCKKQLSRFKRFREHWGTKGVDFMQSIEPKELPAELVYPFGGGDLMMALATFPRAEV